MKQIDIDKITDAIYTEFCTLGRLWEDDAISWGFLKKARRLYEEQFFYSIKWLMKRDRKQVKRAFKLFIQADNLLAKKNAEKRKQAAMAARRALEVQENEVIQETRKKIRKKACKRIDCCCGKSYLL